MMRLVQIVSFLLVLLTVQAADKPGLVLLPVQGAGLTSGEMDVLRASAQEVLSREYAVFSGGDVDTKLQKTSKKICDATLCLQEVAIAFQATLIGRVVIDRDSSGVAATLEIVDIFRDGEVKFSKTKVCDKCDKGRLVTTVKSLFDPAPAEAAPQDAFAAAVRAQESSRAAKSDGRLVLTDQGGKPLGDVAADWVCVFDSKTGLLWEAKTREDDLRDASGTYTFFDGSRGTPGGGSCEGGVRCDTASYIAELNRVGLCGKLDWRLPSARELKQVGRAKGFIASLRLPAAGLYWSDSEGSNLGFGMFSKIGVSYYPTEGGSAEAHEGPMFSNMPQKILAVSGLPKKAAQ